MGTINYNGKVYKGDNISIINNNIYIDGVLTDTTQKEKTFVEKLINWINPIKISKIEISGDVKITAEHSHIDIRGNLTLSEANGMKNCDIRCQDFNSTADVNCADFIADNVKCANINSADFSADNVTAGDIKLSGDLNCDKLDCKLITVGGDASTDNINGDVTVSGDLNCDDITGNVKANEINADTVKIIS